MTTNNQIITIMVGTMEVNVVDITPMFSMTRKPDILCMITDLSESAE